MYNKKMFLGTLQSFAILQYRDDENDETLYEEEDDEDQRGSRMHHAHSQKNVVYSHPTFPGKGQLILGQEQEILCGGFDDTDSLSADISGFEVLPIR